MATYNNRYGFATAAVAAFSVAVALLSQVKERFSPTPKLVVFETAGNSSSYQIATNDVAALKMISDRSVMMGMSVGKGPVYMNIELPGGHHWSTNPDPCAHSYVRTYTDWLKIIPEKCIGGYEEAGLYTSTTGVRLIENKFLEGALRRNGWYHSSKSSLYKNRNLYTFLKLRACVPEGSACYPNGKLLIDTSVYYNIIALNHGLLGVDKGKGKTERWEQRYQDKSQTVTYNVGPFYPDHEYVFKPEDQRQEERNQWRFEEANDGSGSYLLINRWTGQYMGYGSKRHGGIEDDVGQSKLYKSQAIKVSVGTDCDDLGTVTLEAKGIGNFKKGMTSTLFFSANDPNPSYESKETGCAWSPSCDSGWYTHATSSSGCVWGFTWKKCRKNYPKPSQANKNNLKFQLREVTLHIEPQISHKYKDVKAVKVNSGTSMSLNEIALQSIATKFGVERGRDLVEAAMNFHFDNPDWRPFNRYRPKSIPKGFGGVIAASRFYGSVGKPLSSTSKISSSLKFASLGGPALALFTGFLSAYLDYKAAEATEKRFQAIEERLNEIVKYIDALHTETKWVIVKGKYDDLYKNTFLKYQQDTANFRSEGFGSLDEQIGDEIPYKMELWMDTKLQSMSTFFTLPENLPPFIINYNGIPEEEVADYIMSFYPAVVISYIQLIEEMVSLEAAVFKRLENDTCEEVVDYMFGKVTKYKEAMQGEALKLATKVENKRAAKTVFVDDSENRIVFWPVFCPPPMRPMSISSNDNTLEDDENEGVTLETSTIEDTESEGVAVPPSSAPLDLNALIENLTVAMQSIDDDSAIRVQYDNCPPPFTHKFYYGFKLMKESDEELLKVKIDQHSIYNQVLKLRQDEIKWTFRNFGKYSIQGLYDAVDGAEASIIDTCEKLRSDEAYANEYIEHGKDLPLAAFDEVKDQCPSS